MNSEILILQAGEAIKKFRKNHGGACVLLIRNGAVICLPAKDCNFRSPRSLHITTFQQLVGFTNSQWAAVGESLLNLYNKEIKCQTHPKP